MRRFGLPIGFLLSTGAVASVFFGASIAEAQSCVEGIYYMENDAAVRPSRLYSVTLNHLELTADLALISEVPDEHGRQLHMATIADGSRMYAVDNPTHKLSMYDVIEGTWSSVCILGGELNAAAAVTQAAFSPSDDLYVGVYTVGNGIYRVTLDPVEGVCNTTLVVPFAPTNGGDLAFAPDGTLYQVNRTSNASSLYRVDLSSGDVTMIGTVFGDGRVTGTAFSRQGPLAGKLLGTIPGASPVGDTLRILDPTVGPNVSPEVDAYAWRLNGAPYTAVTGGDMANSECAYVSCGDGIVNAGEQCDAGDQNVCNFGCCNTECMCPRCGDGVVQRLDCPECPSHNAEQCDDGNALDGDGCSATCRIERCGNGTVDIDEQCDDGNTNSDDGCSASCMHEGEPNCCSDDGGKPTYMELRFSHPAVLGANSILVNHGSKCDDFKSKFVSDSEVWTGAVPVDAHAPSKKNDSNLAITNVEGGTLTLAIDGSHKLNSNSSFRVKIDSDEFTGCIHTSCSQPLYVGQVFGTYFEVTDLSGSNVDPDNPFCQ